MKRIITAIIAVAMLSTILMAQETDKSEKRNTPHPVQRVEGELFAGIPFPADSYHGATAKPGLQLGAAIRYNFTGTPFDVGLQFDYTIVNHGNIQSENYYGGQTNTLLSLTATGAYNFRQGHNVNPFAGIGMGFARMHVDQGYPYPVNGYNYLLVPKIGCEFWGLFRVYASAHVIRKGFNSLEIGIGVVLAGRPKRK